jgi:hypothetical protein
LLRGIHLTRDPWEYVRYIVARSRNDCGHGNATVCSLFIVAGVDVVVNNIKMFSVAMEMQQWVSFTLVSSYKTFPTAVHTNKY